jgi:hypothetical protein
MDGNNDRMTDGLGNGKMGWLIYVQSLALGNWAQDSEGFWVEDKEPR